MYDLSQLQDRFRGALLGGAIGDAIGAPFEGAAQTSWLDLEHSQRDDLPFTRYTDDTHMSIGLAESLLARRGFDGSHLITTWAQRYHAEPWRGYGAGPPQIFRLIEQGIPWDQAAGQLFGGLGSYGNGAAMRAAPAALLAYTDLEAVAELARRQAALTHAHALGIEGAVLQAVAVALLLRTPHETPLSPVQFLDTLLPRVCEPTYQRRLGIIYRLGQDAPPELVAERLGNGIAAHESVPTALSCFLRSPHSFAATVGFALRLGGDTDTIAAMAGTLSGAYLGAAALPARWCAQVEHAAHLIELADQLLAASLSYNAGRSRPKDLIREV